MLNGSMLAEPMVMLPAARPQGFTLIEMMVVVAIIVIVMTLGLPSYRVWVQNTQIYNAAESTLSGLQKAKAEAVKRNTNVQFVLGTDPAWQLQVPAGAVIEAATPQGAKNVTSTATPTGATTVTFSNLGGVTTNLDGSATITQIDFTSSLVQNTRNLRVTIGVNGIGSGIRMCDPSAELSTTDPRHC
jgi:type IV fimbrial biogenesis protein FimT